MSKVLVLSTWSRPGGGPQGYTYNLKAGLESIETGEVSFDFWSSKVINSRTLNSNSVKARVISLTPSFFRQYIVVFGIVAGQIKLRLNRELRLKVSHADTLIVHDQGFALLVPYIKRAKKKFIYMQHTPTSWTEEVIRTAGLVNYGAIRFVCSRIEKYLLASCDEVIIPSVNSINSYDEFKVYHKEDALKKSRIIVSGAPRLLPNNEQSFRVNRKVAVGYLGRYHNHKGFDRFVELYQLSVDDDRYHFYSAGTGSIVPSKSKNYTDYGWTTNVADFIDDMDIIVCPNRYTYFDLLPLEVMSIGKVLIVSEVGGNIDLMTYSSGIFGVNSNNSSDYKTVLDTVVGSEGFQKKTFHEMNKLAFEKYFTLERMAERYKESFE
jgi:glycosyltransferase involved in cell wall biosynthesis